MSHADRDVSASSTSSASFCRKIQQCLRATLQRLLHAGERHVRTVSELHELRKGGNRYRTTIPRGQLRYGFQHTVGHAGFESVGRDRQFRIAGSRLAFHYLTGMFEDALATLDCRGDALQRDPLGPALGDLALEEAHWNTDLPCAGQRGIDPILGRLRLCGHRAGTRKPHGNHRRGTDSHISSTHINCFPCIIRAL